MGMWKHVLTDLCGGRQGLSMVCGQLQMLDWCGPSLLQVARRVTEGLSSESIGLA